MSKRKPDVYLQDILESILQIEGDLDGVSGNEFYQNSEKQDAVLTSAGAYWRSSKTYS